MTLAMMSPFYAVCRSIAFPIITAAALLQSRKPVGWVVQHLPAVCTRHVIRRDRSALSRAIRGSTPSSVRRPARLILRRDRSSYMGHPAGQCHMAASR